MKESIVLLPGIRYVLKEYHNVLVVVLQERKQTQAEASRELGISVSTFQKILRLRCLPNFHTSRGKLLAQRFERWSTVRIELLFPEAFFTKEFLQSPKTHVKTQTFRLLSKSGKSADFKLALLAALQSPEPRPTSRRRKKRKSSKK